MNQEEREEKQYKEGKRNPIDVEEEFITEIIKPHAEKLLDIGCGIGNIADLYEKKIKEIHGIDISKSAIKQFTKRGHKGKQYDLDRGIPYPDNTFKTILALDVIEHVIDPIQLAQEIERVAQPGAQIIITTPNELDLKMRLQLILLGRSPHYWDYKRLRFNKHHTLMCKKTFQTIMNTTRLKLKRTWTAEKKPLMEEGQITRGIKTLFGKTIIYEYTK